MSRAAWMYMATEALRELLTDQALWEAVRTDVEAYFAETPEMPRTEQSQGLVTVLVFERLTTAPADPDQSTKQAA